MPAVVLEDNEWQQVLGILATAPWRDANPLLMKIGGQLQTQREFAQHGGPPFKQHGGPPQFIKPEGNGQQEAEP